ncbi:hypothetical protein NMG60_11016751 [Bertholletia excelsa]
MALEAESYPQALFGYSCKDFYSPVWGYDEFISLQEEDGSLAGILDYSWEHSSSSSAMQSVKEQHWDPNSSPETCTGDQMTSAEAAPPEPAPSRRKRRRTRCCKNKEELENQRMTHIAVERNRRKQMNEYLACIRSLMPSSYVQRGDQASVIGGAINFVKELEQLLQTLEAQKSSTQKADCSSAQPFADFFCFPQYSNGSTGSPVAENRSGLAEIEVNVVESHANLKILSKKRPRQLLKLVAGLQCLRFSVLHLNVTTVQQTVLYSISVKIEEGCQATTVDEIADAINGLLGRIEEEAAALS